VLLMSSAGAAIDTHAVLGALAEPRRADIVRLLEKQYRSQRDLSDELGMSQPLVSHHLRVLRDAGLVTSTVCERVTVYVLRPSTLNALAARLEKMAAHAAEIAKTKPC
jgi:ArsR family transcriptional regulator